MKRVLTIIAAVVAVAAVIAGAAGYIFWSGLKQTPEYSLALLIDAAKRDDQADVDRLVDTDAVVDNFVPQVTEKAVELYGRNQPPSVIAKASRVAAPLMPAVKERAREELPGIIRRETERFGDVPFAAMAVFADRYFQADVKGDTAEMRSLVPGREFQVSMRRQGEGWQVVEVRDESLARQIAETIGQQLIAIAANGGGPNSAVELGGANLQQLLKQAQEAFE